MDEVHLRQLDQALLGLSSLNRRLGMRCDAASQYPVEIRIELSRWESLKELLGFLRYVRDAANGGHSFVIEADREDGGSSADLEKYGLRGTYPRVGVDGDGNDKVGRIWVNGELLK